jgi:hypothetical protein
MIMYSVITDSCRVITILIIEIKPALSCWTQPSQVLRSGKNDIVFIFKLQC